MKLYNQNNFWQMLVYIILLWASMDLYKKTLLKYWEYTVKKRPIIVITGHFHFKI